MGFDEGHDPATESLLNDLEKGREQSHVQMYVTSDSTSSADEYSNTNLVRSNASRFKQILTCSVVA